MHNQKAKICLSFFFLKDNTKTLIEQGFEYVTEIDNVKLFRKRK